LNLLSAWYPGPKNRHHAEEYELQHIALALQNLSKLYEAKTIPLFYLPFYKDFVIKELEGDIKQEGSKIQFA